MADHPPRKKRRGRQVSAALGSAAQGQDTTRPEANGRADANSDVASMVKEVLTATLPTLIPTITTSVLAAIQKGGLDQTAGQLQELVAPQPAGPSLQEEGQPDTVSSAAAECLVDLTGMSAPSNTLGQRHLHKPFDLGLDPKIKGKIWADEYVDFGLLAHPSSDHKEKYTTEVKDGTLSLVKVPNSKKIENLRQWCGAFHLFGAIYTKKHTDKGNVLFQYAKRVQDIADESGDSAALQYDRSFRLWREMEPSDCPWEHLNIPLYHEALAEGLSSKFRSKQGQPFRANSGNKRPFLNKRKPKVYCHSYNNNGGKCTRGQSCTYPHICELCGGSHDRSKCPTKQDTNSHQTHKPTATSTVRSDKT